jgi:CheY-like chemotaxis protein
MSREKILAIDDSPTVRKLFEMILASEGYEIITAADGIEGIAKAKVEEPAVVLVDFVMPKMNGYQVCKVLKEHPKLKDTPIILVTSKGESVGSRFVDVLGITEYFVKPFQPEDLLQKIREVLDRLHEGEALPVSGEEAEEPVAATADDEAEVAVSAATPLQEVPPPFAPHPEGEWLEAKVYPESEPAVSPLVEAQIQGLLHRLLEQYFQERFPALLEQHLQPYLSGLTTSRRGQESISTAHLAPHLEGSLASFSLADILQLISMQKQTGRLTLEHFGQRCAIFFEEGLVIFAAQDDGKEEDLLGAVLLERGKTTRLQLQHARKLTQVTREPLARIFVKERFMPEDTLEEVVRTETERTIYTALGWAEGHFAFVPCPPPAFLGETPCALKAADLILEGVRRLDEWKMVSQKIPHLDMVFAKRPFDPEDLKKLHLKASEMKVFQLIDGKRDVKTLVKQSGLGDFEVCKLLYLLLSANLLQPAPPMERAVKRTHYL